MGGERSYIECKYEPDSKFAVAAVAAVAVAAAVIVVVAVAAAAAALRGPHPGRGSKESLKNFIKVTTVRYHSRVVYRQRT